MLGVAEEMRIVSARLARNMAANDARQDYVRARIVVENGELWADPFDVQDSSMQAVFAAADALILRPPHAPAAEAGERVDVLSLADC
jgi:molybdopterin molybdotransferase